MTPPADHPRYWSEGEPRYRVFATDVFAAEPAAPVVRDVLLLSVFGALNLVDVMTEFVKQRPRQQQIPYEAQLQKPSRRAVQDLVHEDLDPGCLASPSWMVQTGHLRVPRLVPATPGPSPLPSTRESGRIGEDHAPETGQVFRWHCLKQLGYATARVTGGGKVPVRFDDLDHLDRAYYGGALKARRRTRR